MEWLDKGSYNYDPKHPPLGRIPTALGLYLQGARSTGNASPYAEGNTLLAWEGKYCNNLSAARLGVLPFFLAACYVVWAWTVWAYGRPAGLIAVLLFSSTPPVLGHAGLAMTDIALAATLPAALFCFCLWMSRPAEARSVMLGAVVGLAILSKFTALAFLAVGFFLIALASRSLGAAPKVRSILLALLVTALTIWAGYRFSFTPLEPEGLPLPAGDFVRGVYQLWLHNHESHPNTFLGERSWKGWWWFYPVVLAVKTPIGFLMLAAIGILFAIRNPPIRTQWRTWTPVLPAVGMLIVGFMSHVNTGVRHILPIYAMLAGVAAFGAVGLWNAGRVWSWLCVALLAWHLTSSALAHPDYLPYFNELAIGEPGSYGVDSDLDYGQDLWRLRDACARLHVDSMWIAYNGSADLNLFGLPKWHALPPDAPQTGWVAISIYKLKLGEATDQSPENFSAYSWLEKFHPAAYVGKSMRLYFIPITHSRTTGMDADPYSLPALTVATGTSLR